MELNEKMLMGIEYVNNRSLHSVICILDEVAGELEFLTATSQEEADEKIKQQILSRSPAYVFINAPLTLPGAYFSDDGKDFFYRECDKQLKCPSPMLNGELLARSIRLKHQVQNLADITIFETYPVYLAKELTIDEYGFGEEELDIKQVLKKLQSKFDYPLDHRQINTKQHLNALLCLLSAIRYKEGESEAYGDDEEGLIII